MREQRNSRHVVQCTKCITTFEAKCRRQRPKAAFLLPVTSQRCAALHIQVTKGGDKPQASRGQDMKCLFTLNGKCKMCTPHLSQVTCYGLDPSCHMLKSSIRVRRNVLCQLRLFRRQWSRGQRAQGVIIKQNGIEGASGGNVPTTTFRTSGINF